MYLLHVHIVADGRNLEHTMPAHNSVLLFHAWMGRPDDGHLPPDKFHVL